VAYPSPEFDLNHQTGRRRTGFPVTFGGDARSPTFSGTSARDSGAGARESGREAADLRPRAFSRTAATSLRERVTPRPPVLSADAQSRCGRALSWAGKLHFVATLASRLPGDSGGVRAPGVTLRAEWRVGRRAQCCGSASASTTRRLARASGVGA
jgi:hypothetical protein